MAATCSPSGSGCNRSRLWRNWWALFKCSSGFTLVRFLSIGLQKRALGRNSVTGVQYNYILLMSSGKPPYLPFAAPSSNSLHQDYTDPRQATDRLGYVRDNVGCPGGRSPAMISPNRRGVTIWMREISALDTRAARITASSVSVGQGLFDQAVRLVIFSAIMPGASPEGKSLQLVYVAGTCSWLAKSRCC